MTRVTLRGWVAAPPRSAALGNDGAAARLPPVRRESDEGAVDEAGLLGGARLRECKRALKTRKLAAGSAAAPDRREDEAVESGAGPPAPPPLQGDAFARAEGFEVTEATTDAETNVVSSILNPSRCTISVGVSDALTRPHRTFVL